MEGEIYTKMAGVEGDGYQGERPTPNKVTW
jgi:hypothetical protein